MCRQLIIKCYLLFKKIKVVLISCNYSIFYILLFPDKEYYLLKLILCKPTTRKSCFSNQYQCPYFSRVFICFTRQNPFPQNFLFHFKSVVLNIIYFKNNYHKKGKYFFLFSYLKQSYIIILLFRIPNEQYQ